MEIKNGTPESVQRLAHLATAVFRAGFPEQYDMLRTFPNLFDTKNARNLYYIQEGGRPVSMVGLVESRCVVDGCGLSAASIGAVCTLPEYRGRKMATQILAKVFGDLEKRRTALALISGGGPLYLNFGCVPAGSLLMASWNGEPEVAWVNEYETRQIASDQRPGSVSRILPLYRHERFRFRRSSGFMKGALDSGRFRDSRYDQELFETTLNGKAAAYLVAQVNHQSPSNVNVIEWAGARNGFITGLKAAMNWFKAKSATFKLQPSDDEMLGLISRLKMDAVTTQVQGTIRPVNVRAMVEELQPLIEERLGGELVLDEESEEEWRFSGPFGNKTVQGRPSLTRWLFGQSDGDIGVPLMPTDDMNYV